MITRIAKSLGISILLYALMVALLLSVPHKSDGFGRMNAHQAFAGVGMVLSFGLVDRTLVDWYMLDPTLSEQTDHYDRIVYRSLLVLAPIYLAWFGGLSYLAASVRNVRHGA
jgi:hypothetical protein